MLSAINVMLITENTDRHSWHPSLIPMSSCRSIVASLTRPRHRWKLHGPAETLVSLGVIVLETDLKLDSFEEISLLCFVGVFEKLCNSMQCYLTVIEKMRSIWVL